MTPSPKSEPSGRTTAARPPGFSRRMIRARNRSAVSRVRKACGKFDSIPSSSRPPKGGFGQDDVDPLVLAPRDVGAGQRVVVAQEGRVLDPVQQHVGDGEHVGELLLLHRAQGGLHRRLVLGPLHVMLAHVADRAGQEAAGAAGRVEQDFAGARVDLPRHEGGDGAGGVVLARVAGRLQVVEDLFVDVAEVLALGEVVEVDAVDAVDHLPHELAGLHVVVGVLEDVAHGARARRRGGELLEGREEVVVDEVQERPRR